MSANESSYDCVIIPELTYVCEMAEQWDKMSSVKLGRFQSQLEVSCMSSHTEKLWYNETVCLWMTIYVYIYIYIFIGIVSRVFANRPGDWGSIPGQVIPKIQKWYLMPPWLILRIIRYGSRVSWEIQEKGKCPPLHHGVIAIEKGTFRLPLTSVSQLIY